MSRNNLLLPLKIFVVLRNGILLLMILSLEVSAQDAFYTPKALFIPVYSRPNQVHVSLGVGGGLEGTISYAGYGGFLLYGSYWVHNWESPRLDLFNSYSLQRQDHGYRIGLGNFHFRHGKFFNVIETIGGFGNTYNENYRKYNNPDVSLFCATKSSSWTTFVQVNAVHKKARTEFGLALRLAYTKFTDLNYFDDLGTYHREGLTNISADPVGSFSVKISGVKINLQGGFSIPLAGSRGTGFENGKETTSAEALPLFTVLGRLAIQYNFDLNSNN